MAAFSCGIEPTKFPFPPVAEVTTGQLSAVLARKTLRVGDTAPIQLRALRGLGPNPDPNPNPNPNPTQP